MRDKRFIGTAGFAMVLFSAATAHAGMPSAIGLSQYAVERTVGLSTAVFLGLVVSTLLIRFCWGILVHETDWPRPTLLKSFAASLLGGMLFFLILVMIAGSRELFSPGAWVPDGVLYRLAASPLPTSTPQAAPSNEIIVVRRAALETLRDHLKTLAASKTGLPTTRKLFQPENFTERKALEIWTVPFASGIRYEYHPDETDGPWLVVEPALLEQQTPKIRRLAVDRKTFEIVDVPRPASTETPK